MVCDFLSQAEQSNRDPFRLADPVVSQESDAMKTPKLAAQVPYGQGEAKPITTQCKYRHSRQRRRVFFERGNFSYFVPLATKRLWKPNGKCDEFTPNRATSVIVFASSTAT